MTTQTTAVKLIALDDDTAIVGGWGVIFGGKDLYGETFTKSTDFMLDLVPNKPVLYDHSLGEVKHIIGKAIKVEPRDAGLWVEAELKRNEEYVSQVLELVQKGALGWSSGSVSHLVRMDGSQIKAWPLIEMSLTPTPAEPRTLGVEVIKTLAESDPSFEALMPEAGGNPAASADDAEIEVKNVESEEMNTMATEAKSVEESAQIDVAALLDGMKSLASDVAIVKKALEQEPPVNAVSASAPAVIKTRGDSEVKSFARYIRTGDEGALGDAYKASNATDMNIGTPADGGYAVPTGHYQGIIARRDEDMLAPRLGLLNIPGKGLTVNVPIDNEADGEFVATAEATDFDLDAPALDQKAMTLVKYTKTIMLSDELLQDEDSRLMEFLNNFVGRGIAKTHNSLLLTELRAGGTNFGAIGTTSAVNIADISKMVYGLPDPYHDNAAWIMKRAVEGHIRGLTSASDFQYVPKVMGTTSGQAELWTYPVYNSEYASAIAGGAKSLIFGNFRYVGYRDGGGITLLRDQFSKARQGQLCLHYQFRAVYKVLQAEAVIYGTHPTA